MPIYEYRCSKCGDFETMQKISDAPLTSCPTCRRKVTKLISSTSFQLKGTGWYVTDYARKSGAKSEKGTDKAAAKGEGAAAEAGGGSADEGAKPAKAKPAKAATESKAA